MKEKFKAPRLAGHQLSLTGSADPSDCERSELLSEGGVSPGGRGRFRSLAPQQPLLVSDTLSLQRST